MFFGDRYTTIDIGSYSIKLARFQQKKGNLELLNAGSRELPPESIKEGMVVEPAIIAGRLDELFKELKYRPARIVTTVPSNNLVVRNMELPQMTEKELADAIRWEADEYLPFPAETAMMDYIVLSRGEVIKVLVMAVKEEVVKSFLEPFESLGLKPAVVNIQPLALLSLLEYQGRITEPLAIIDIGASSTRVVIGDKNNIFLARNIDTGGEDFTQYIMEAQKFDHSEAENYKRENGLQAADSRSEESQLDFDLAFDEVGAVESDFDFGTAMGSGLAGENYLLTMAQHLAGEIARSLNFYPAKFRGQTIEEIYIIGGGAHLEGLKEIISKEINRELKEISPVEKFTSHLSAETNLGDFAVAIGLAASEVLANEGKSA